MKRHALYSAALLCCIPFVSGALSNVTVDDMSAEIIYGGGTWTGSTGGGVTLHTSSDAAATASFEFTGVAVYVSCPQWASNIDALISLDGAAASPLSSGPASGEVTEIVWARTGLANKQHTVVISKKSGVQLVGLDSITFTIDSTPVGTTHKLVPATTSSTTPVAAHTNLAVNNGNAPSDTSSSNPTSSTNLPPLPASMSSPLTTATSHSGATPNTGADSTVPSSLPAEPTSDKSIVIIIVSICAVLIVLLAVGGYMWRRRSRAARKRDWSRKYALSRPAPAAIRRGLRGPGEAPAIFVEQSYPRPPSQYAFSSQAMPTPTSAESLLRPVSAYTLSDVYGGVAQTPYFDASFPPSPLFSANSLPPSRPGSPPAVNPFFTPVPSAPPSPRFDSPWTSESRRGSGVSGLVPSLVGIHPFSAVDEDAERGDLVMPLASSSRLPQQSSAPAPGPALSEKAALAALHRAQDEAAEQQSQSQTERPMSAAPAYREKDAVRAFQRSAPADATARARAVMSVVSVATVAPPVYEP